MVFSEIRYGGSSDGHGRRSGVGFLSKKMYPLVTFGRHHSRKYDLRSRHALTDPEMANTSWVMSVADTCCGEEGKSNVFLRDERQSEDIELGKTG